jgi:hypothetical protein
VGATTMLQGARSVAAEALTFAKLAPFARLLLVNGAAGAVVAPGGTPQAVLGFTVKRGRIVGIDILADPERLRHLDPTALEWDRDSR